MRHITGAVAAVCVGMLLAGGCGSSSDGSSRSAESSTEKRPNGSDSETFTITWEGSSWTYEPRRSGDLVDAIEFSKDATSSPPGEARPAVSITPPAAHTPMTPDGTIEAVEGPDRPFAGGIDVIVPLDEDVAAGMEESIFFQVGNPTPCAVDDWLAAVDSANTSRLGSDHPDDRTGGTYSLLCSIDEPVQFTFESIDDSRVDAFLGELGAGLADAVIRVRFGPPGSESGGPSEYALDACAAWFFPDGTTEMTQAGSSCEVTPAT